MAELVGGKVRYLRIHGTVFQRLSSDTFIYVTSKIYLGSTQQSSETQVGGADNEAREPKSKRTEKIIFTPV